MDRPSPHTGSAPPAPGATPPSRFSLYARPTDETPATIAARRALMSRKGVSNEEMDLRAEERRRQHVGRHRGSGRRGLGLAAAGVAGLLMAWGGSRMGWQALLLGGYAVTALTVVAILAQLERRTASGHPLEHYYLPDEHLADAEDIALLRRIAAADAEVEAATAAWWRDPTPIRKYDVRLALDLQHAKRG